IKNNSNIGLGLKILENVVNPLHLATVEARARYSASVDDIETILYFFEFHETRDVPMKTQYPIVDLRVLGHVAQSESLNPFIYILESA
ncbi:hypothetical protein QYE93_26110, partial [Enterobacter cloacae subsp. cloacae]|uniref:hypothetical protein n=1 Tax=Enterobacter cloacae TaxID=550 RepID=UPI0028740F25